MAPRSGAMRKACFEASSDEAMPAGKLSGGGGWLTNGDDEKINNSVVSDADFYCLQTRYSA